MMVQFASKMYKKDNTELIQLTSVVPSQRLFI